MGVLGDSSKVELSVSRPAGIGTGIVAEVLRGTSAVLLCNVLNGHRSLASHRGESIVNYYM